MGKHGRKSKRNWQSIEIDVEIDYGASGLAAKALIKTAMSEIADSDFIATSVIATYTAQVEQAADPNGLSNIALGLAKSDYTAQEIEEWIENSSGFKRANLIAQEISKRMIKNIGVFQPETRVLAEHVNMELNDGMPVKTRLNWRIMEQTTLSFWIYNGGGTAIVTSGNQKCRVIGQIRGFWDD